MNNVLNGVQAFFKEPIVKFGLLLGLALMLAAGSLGDAIAARNLDENISVTGAASQEITSDNASWEIHYTRQSKDLKSGYAQIAADLTRVKAFLKAQGLKEADYNPGSVNTTTLYSKNSQGYDTNNVEAYRLEQSVRVELKDPQKVEAISQNTADLVNQGVMLESTSPQYYYSKLDDLKIDMIGEATKNAVERGRKIAQSTGRDVGVLRSANVGVFQITAKNSTEVSDYGIYDTSSREKKVTAVVNATFSVR